VDGEEQELRYINVGNAPDADQQAWRASLGVKVVSPMLEAAYAPPDLHLCTRAHCDRTQDRVVYSRAYWAYRVKGGRKKRKKDTDQPRDQPQPHDPPIIFDGPNPKNEPTDEIKPGEGDGKPEKGNGQPEKGQWPTGKRAMANRKKGNGKPTKGNRRPRPGRPGGSPAESLFFRAPFSLCSSPILALGRPQSVGETCSATWDRDWKIASSAGLRLSGVLSQLGEAAAEGFVRGCGYSRHRRTGSGRCPAGRGQVNLPAAPPTRLQGLSSPPGGATHPARQGLSSLLAAPAHPPAGTPIPGQKGRVPPQSTTPPPAGARPPSAAQDRTICREESPQARGAPGAKTKTIRA